MARITIEDCLKTGVYDKFDLVLIASQRTKQLNAGAHTEVDKNVKNTLRSLIEIEENKVPVDDIREAVIRSYQKYGQSDESERMEDDSFVEDSYDNADHDMDMNDDLSEDADEDIDDVDESDYGLNDLDFDDK